MTSAPASIRSWANARFSGLTSADREVAQLVDPRPQLPDVFLHQERIHRDDAGPAIGRERGLADIVELGVAKKAELDAIALDDDRLARVGEIGSAADMGNPGQ
jgi:hypothetical protein